MGGWVGVCGDVGSISPCMDGWKESKPREMQLYSHNLPPPLCSPSSSMPCSSAEGASSDASTKGPDAARSVCPWRNTSRTRGGCGGRCWCGRVLRPSGLLVAVPMRLLPLEGLVVLLSVLVVGSGGGGEGVRGGEVEEGEWAMTSLDFLCAFCGVVCVWERGGLLSIVCGVRWMDRIESRKIKIAARASLRHPTDPLDHPLSACALDVKSSQVEQAARPAASSRPGRKEFNRRRPKPPEADDEREGVLFAFVCVHVPACGPAPNPFTPTPPSPQAPKPPQPTHRSRSQAQAAGRLARFLLLL